MIFRRRKSFCFGLLFLLIGGLLFAAGGRQDSVLDQADALIEQQRYGEAVLLLSEYIREHPDKFDDAQDKLRRVMQIRNQFNTLANELLDVLTYDPDNNDRILDISNRLSALGSASDSSTQGFLTQVRELAAFNVNRNRLDQVLAEARARLEREDFSGAFSVYADGMSIYQAEFFAAGYGAETDQIARNGIQAVSDSAAGFAEYAAVFDREAAALEGLRNSGPPAGTLGAVFDSLAPALEGIAAARSSLVFTGDEYENRFQFLRRENPGLQDRSFLTFAGRLIRGPAGENEGMIGTIDRYRELRIRPAENAAAEIAANGYAAAFEAVNRGDYESAPALIDAAREYLVVSGRFIDSRALFAESGGELPVPLFGESVPPRDIGDFLEYRAMEQALGFFADVVRIGLAADVLDYASLADWRTDAITVSAAISREQETRAALDRLETEAAGLQSAIDAEINEYENLRGQSPELLANAEPISYLNQARAIAGNLNADIENRQLQAFVRFFTISNTNLETQVNERYAQFAEGSSLVSGIVRQVESEGEIIDYTYFYPQEGSTVLSEMNRIIPETIADAEALLALYGRELSETLRSAEAAALYGEAADMLDRLRNLRSQAASLISAAIPNIDLAATLRQEGDRLYLEAQTALARSAFDLARNRLDLSQGRYNESLAIQESEPLRQLRDDRLITLGQEIVRLENEFVVREVRDYVTRARAAYYSGSFDQAEDLLIRAQNRWRTTNATEEPEITYWLTMTRNALSLNSGRVIPVTAPLYAEMGQLLSDARRNYDEGVRLINAGRRQEGLARFNDARGMTQKVELMFPLNREARLLDLSIEQFTDPAVFNAAFRQRLNEAIAGTRPSVRSVESFADLQNLAEINPEYPGIAQIIVQAEVDMGYRPPPPDTRALARSESLTGDARPIVENQNSAMYEVALVWLNEALTLNPNNTQAAVLKDALQVRQTGTGSITLDSVSYERYQRAVMEFQRGNRYTAWAIVLQLLEDPQNQKSMQIQDLQRRIESSL